MAEKELGIKGNVIQSFQQTDFIPNLTTAARQADVVVALGYLMADAISEVAARFPNVKFILVDSAAEELPNLASYEVRAGQGAYLAGIIAAAVTQMGRVGMVELHVYSTGDCLYCRFGSRHQDLERADRQQR